jgi:hypothetical protein
MLGPSFSPIYLTSCTDSRDAVRDLVSKYTPTDSRFVPYASEARALWHIKHYLRAAMAFPNGALPGLKDACEVAYKAHITGTLRLKSVKFTHCVQVGILLAFLHQVHGCT